MGGRGSDSRRRVIELIDVSRTVPSGAGPLTILHPTSLHVDRGRAVAITGPSGSGKSTLLGLIAGLDAPTTGRIVIDGMDITALGEEALARLRGEKIGIVFQFFHLMPSLTAFENVLVPMEIAGAPRPRDRAAALLAEVGLSRPRAPLPVATLGRRAAARGHRAGAGQRPAHPAGRRAHRESRQRHGPAGHRSARGREPATRPDARPRHPRSRRSRRWPTSRSRCATAASSSGGPRPGTAG